MSRCRLRRQAARDEDRDLLAGALLPQQRHGRLGQPAAEIRPGQVGGLIGATALDAQHGQPERRQRRLHRIEVEARMHGVPRERMGGAEGEVVGGRDPRPAAAEADAGGGIGAKTCEAVHSGSRQQALEALGHVERPHAPGLVR